LARDHTHKQLIADVIYSPEYQHHPKHVKTPKNMATDTKRIEVRFPDPSCNGYLSFSSMLMAGLDGISIRVKSTGAFIQSLQSGMLRLYATLMVIGAIAIVIFVVVIGMIR